MKPVARRAKDRRQPSDASRAKQQSPASPPLSVSSLPPPPPLPCPPSLPPLPYLVGAGLHLLQQARADGQTVAPRQRQHLPRPARPRSASRTRLARPAGPPPQANCKQFYSSVSFIAHKTSPPTPSTCRGRAGGERPSIGAPRERTCPAAWSRIRVFRPSESSPLPSHALSSPPVAALPRLPSSLCSPRLADGAEGGAATVNVRIL